MSLEPRSLFFGSVRNKRVYKVLIAFIYIRTEIDGAIFVDPCGEIGDVHGYFLFQSDDAAFA